MKNQVTKFFFCRFSGAFLMLLISNAASFAAIISWKGANGAVGINWNRASNWSTGSVPTSSDDVFIGNVSITQQPTILSGTTGTCKSITIGGAYASIVTVNGNLTIANDVTITANGTLNHLTPNTMSVTNFTILAGATYTQTGTASLTCSGNFTGSGTCNYSSASSVSLSSFYPVISGTNLMFGNLTLPWLGITTVTAPLTINNSLTFLGSFSVLDLGTFPLVGSINLVTGTGTLKTQNTSATAIPDGLSFAGPVYYNGTGSQTISNGSYTNLDATGGNRTLDASGTISISGTFTPGAGTYTVTGSTVVFNGTTAQTIPAFSFHNLKIANSAGALLAGAVRVKNSLGFGSVNNSVLTTNGLLTLSSDSYTTANLLDITNGGLNVGNNISGLTTVERYIPGKRAYRFLTAPLTSTTSIKANWMENVVNASATSPNKDTFPGYGTQITGIGGSVNGFDPTATNNPSLFTFSASSQAWVPAANTNSVFTTGAAYRILVRGDRNVNLKDNGAISSPTTLRAKGSLITGDVKFVKIGGTGGMPLLSGINGGYSFISNPYASVIDYDTLVKTDLDSSIYVFDPSISGSYGRGGYVAYNTFQRRNSNSNSQIGNFIQSGQAFFVRTRGLNPSLTFKERNKATTIRSVFRTTNDIPNIHVQLLLTEQVTNGGSADGIAAYFSDDYNNSIGGEDSYKFANQDENIAILRDGETLSLEGRKPVVGADSIPIQMWQLTRSDYSLKIVLENFSENILVYLEDKYLAIKVPVRNGETIVPFGINSNTSSNASNRFKIVFETLATLPVKLSSIKAYVKNKGVQVDWTTESEEGTGYYEVERSTNGQQYLVIGFAKAKNSGISAAYNFFDNSPNAGDNFYRIKATEKSGDIKMSDVVKVHVAQTKKTISITNNPVSGSSINLLFNNLTPGQYNVVLITSTGEKVLSTKLAYAGGVVNQTIDLRSHLSTGVYQLQIANGTLNKTLPVLIK
jgi:hypothetical protein